MTNTLYVLIFFENKKIIFISFADASKDFTDICPQPNFDGQSLDPRSTEDCLKLNVYSPELPSEANPEPNLPVMFYIHGGAFSARSGNIDTFGPQFMMDYGVVLVIADYR